MKFTILQKVKVWQKFDIEADTEEQAIALVKENPSCGNLDNDGIEALYETEEVLETELYREGEECEDINVLFKYENPDSL